jgi:hypothetical protein
MTDFSMPRQYDILLCLSGTIAYVATSENLTRALSNFREHLADGGRILLEPWFSPPVEDDAGVYPAGLINMFTTPEQKYTHGAHQQRGSLSLNLLT